MKTLIHTALLSESQSIINFLKLKQNNNIQNLPNYTKSIKIFSNENIILVVSGMGKNKTIEALNFVFNNFKIKKAINVGIAGCKDKTIDIGTLFCTTNNCDGIKTATITTLKKPLDDKHLLDTTLVDMESEHFYKFCSSKVDEIYILKVVSDYLDTTIPKKSFVIELIQNSYKLWKKIL